MYACKESSSERELHTVIVHSAADALNADNLTNELKRHGVEITAAHAYSDLDAVLRNCRRRCIVYLSPEMLNDPRKHSRTMPSTILLFRLFVCTTQADWGLLH